LIRKIYVTYISKYKYEGLSKLIEKAKLEGIICGVKLSDRIRITHILFVDDVLLSGKGIVGEWKVTTDVLNVFPRNFKHEN